MSQDFTTVISVEQSPEEVFKAVTDVRAWWSEEIDGGTENVDDVFDYRYEDAHRCKIKVTEVVPSKKIVWRILENHFSFTQDTTEWKDTEVTFDITEMGDKTELRLTHVGLVPEYECYEICSNGWTTYITGSLKNLITTGKGQPNGRGKPQTEDERRLANS